MSLINLVTSFFQDRKGDKGTRVKKRKETQSAKSQQAKLARKYPEIKYNLAKMGGE